MNECVSNADLWFMFFVIEACVVLLLGVAGLVIWADAWARKRER